MSCLPSRRQIPVLQALSDAVFIAGAGKPTLQDIADRLGVSRVSAYETLCRLEVKGYTERVDSKWSLTPTAAPYVKPPGTCPTCGQAIKETEA